MARRDFGKTCGGVFIRPENDRKLLERLSLACDRGGDTSVKDTLRRLLNDALTRDEIDAERTGSALAAAMRPPEGNGR